ncbi:unnamed protein product [Bursaphelenchus xylophilus]|uniref:Origin recognition complex subunit 1 n=1 Tax=Bursaphelenchus xylophilus TaxID=6326 RepID=A0A1I7SVE9_BURXY|nr:unnamed protein product [Bursaphelenchus xylophilus]CAG9101350.1 unnamed protein product [Bursaphelenchus xylophilus]
MLPREILGDQEKFLFYKDLPSIDPKSPRGSRSASKNQKSPLKRSASTHSIGKENVSPRLSRPSPSNRTPSKSPKTTNSSPRKPSSSRKPMSARNLFDNTMDSTMEVDTPKKASPGKRPRKWSKSRSKPQESPQGSASSGSAPSTPSRGRPVRSASRGINYSEDMVVERRSRATTPKKLKAPSRTATPKKQYRTKNESYPFSESDEEVPLEDISDEEQHTPPKRSRTHRTPSKTPTKLNQSPGKSPLKSPRRKLYATLQDNMQKLNLDQSMNTSMTSSCLEDAKKLLWSDSVPIEMKHREDEIKRIRAFCEEGIRPNSISSALYLGGAPGTGKTSCTLHVIHKMQKSKKNKFTFVHLNAGQMIRPEEVYIHFYKAIGLDKSGKKISQKTARMKLGTILSMEDQTRPPIIALVDELDLLLSKKQSVLYDIFNWCSLPESRVNVIAISNTFDLPQRALDKRVQSRLGTNMIHFHPYDFKQINEILVSRLSGFGDRIHKDALKFCSMKVANMSGDIRKSFDIIRRAIDLAVEKGHDQVQVEDVHQSMVEAGETYRMQLVRGFNPDEIRLFKAVVRSLKATGLEMVDFTRVYRSYERACVEDRIEPLSSWELMQLLRDGASIDFYTINKAEAQMNRLISLGFSDYEAEFCLRQLESKEN